jgi:hypothetical protein
MAEIRKMAFGLSLYENMSIVLIFGLSHNFLTFNHTKIDFGFLDHPNTGLSYKILINK